MQLVSFSTTDIVKSQNSRTGSVTVRLMSAKEFKTARGLSGQEGKRQYNDYLREQGKANTAGLAAAMSTGELLVKRFQSTKNGCSVGFVKRDSIRDPKQKKGEVKDVSKADALKALGLSEADLDTIKALSGN